MESIPVIDRPRDIGWLEVICGSMFSGKTEELIRRLRRAEIAKLRVAIFKPAFDDRYSKERIVSHVGSSLPSVLVETAEDIRTAAEHVDVIGIDEAQFFDLDLVEVCADLAASGKRVIVAGLDQDYQGAPFDPMPQLLATAEYITKTLAICVVCGNPANKTQRVTASDERLLVGAGESYEARCRRCFSPTPQPRTAE
ncbi:MAG: thymidine kinase [Ectothiorhodospiraceae bacterium]|nr:thymidine kinase [Ectothiorhodospiraceae bacterium]